VSTPPLFHDPDAITPVIDAFDVVDRSLGEFFAAERICEDWSPTTIRQNGGCLLALGRDGVLVEFGRLSAQTREGWVLGASSVASRLEAEGPMAEPLSETRWLAFVAGLEAALFGLGFIVLQVDELTA
jgi:hypothetical protein